MPIVQHVPIGFLVYALEYEDGKPVFVRDVAGLQESTYLAMTFKFTNDDTVTLYFQLTGEGNDAYTFNNINLGSLGAGGSSGVTTVTDLATRPRPSVQNGELGEEITLVLKAYTDSGYTDLKWTAKQRVKVLWIDSGSSAFTKIVSDNFDEGTNCGWQTSINPSPAYSSYGASTDYCTSIPYSWRIYTGESKYTSTPIITLKKTIQLPQDRQEAFVVVHLRLRPVQCGSFAWLQIKYGDNLLYYAEGLPYNKWLRVALLLPKNAPEQGNLEINVRLSLGAYAVFYTYFDDISVIVK